MPLASIPAAETGPANSAGRKAVVPPDLLDYPVREYVGAMASELAQMARWDGDETLANALDLAAELAAQPGR